MTEHYFKFYSNPRGMRQIRCKCGAESPLCDSNSDALIEWANAHTMPLLGIVRGKDAGKVVIRA